MAMPKQGVAIEIMFNIPFKTNPQSNIASTLKLAPNKNNVLNA
jgi:hypothetical protein|tara:strand:+ start:1401 stop:1529 length:129 start_codon:yes stop_codon:yes gene_type:complete